MLRFIKHIDLHNWKHLLLIADLLVGVLFATLIPPFQKPDEYVHFFRAATLASGTESCSQDQEITAPKPFVDLADRIHALQIEHQYGGKFPLKEFLVSPLVPRESWSERSQINYSICGLPVISYIPHVMATWLAMSLQMSAFYAFLFGRLVVFFIAFGIFLYLFAKSKGISQTGLLVAFSLPMTLHQLTAYSYDVPHIILGFTVFFLITKYVEQSSMNRKQYRVLAATLVLFLLVKSGYEAFLLLPLVLIGKKTIGVSGRWKHVLPVCMLLGTTLAYLGMKQFTSPLPSITSDTGDSGYVYPYLQLKQMFQTPFRLPEVVFTTLDKAKEEYIIGVIGHFGWLDFHADYVIYLFFISLVVYACIFGEVPKKVNALTPLLFFLVSALTISLVITSMYVFWTPVGLPISVGTQGRYFIVLVPLLVYCATYVKRYFVREHLLFVLPLLLYLFLLGRDVYRRYYDYSRLLDQEQEKILILNRKFGEARAVTDRIVQHVSINPQKKLTGFRMFSAEKIITYPYLLEIYDSDCTTKFTEAFFDIQQSETGELRTFFKPIEGASSVCLVVKAYEGRAESGPLQLLVDEDGNLLLEPLYLR